MCGEGRGAQLELPNKSNPEKAGVSFVIGDPNDWEVAGGGGGRWWGCTQHSGISETKR